MDVHGEGSGRECVGGGVLLDDPVVHRHFPPMSTLAEIEHAADALPPEEFAILLAHLAERAKAKRKQPEQRIANLHPGAFQPAPDFDAPLPDEFWLGKDA